jgi:hypothetical protein
MSRLARPFALGAGLLALTTAAARPARACGGCFHPPTEVTVVTDHRMAFSVSTQQTVLWDQIEYSGNPSDFSWVLPVKSGTVVQASNDAWFEALDAMTTPTITGPNHPCSSVGCASGKASGFAAEGASGGVDVLSQSVVGPYDTVTLRSTDPNALENWLASNGYVLPAAMRPTIAAYVSGGFDFIALRLQPGLGVQAMQPVRVVTQGADLSLPLRMVAAGVGATVGITLYVIGEGRYEAAPPFQNAVIVDPELFWYHVQNRSNYQELSQSLMAGNGGRTWVTEFAGKTNLVGSGQQGCGQRGGFYYSGQSLADAYLGQCPCPSVSLPEGGAMRPPAAEASAEAESSVDAPDEATGEGTDAANEALADALVDATGDAQDDVTAAGPFEASLEASDDGASPQSPADASPAPAPDAMTPARVTTSQPVCTGDDLGVALVGLDADNVWVTRLRAVLPANTLSERDLVVQAASDQSPVSNQHTAANYDDPTYSPCGDHSGGCAASASEPRDSGAYVAAGLFCFAAVAGARRAGRRKRPVSGTSNPR